MNNEKIKELINNLDKEQASACQAPFNPIVVRAIAGSGKTRTLTSRVAYTIAKGNSPESMMLLTFTNKASREMLKRIKDLLNDPTIKITGGTFHSVGAMLLRKTAHHLGYKPSFSILDVKDAEKLIDVILVPFLKKHNLKRSEFPNKGVIYGLYSNRINLKKSLKDINYSLSSFEIESIEMILETYQAYKLQVNVMDFDDLIVNFMKILEIEPIREAISSKYKYVFCDEYQDINWIQDRILTLLNKGNDTLYVVGDANQSIYHWRGSDVSYIENFSKRYPNSLSYDITYNYRSKPPILKLAEESINNNYIESDMSVKITPNAVGGTKPIYKKLSEDEQMKYIIEKIKEYRRIGIPYEEMAILLRVNYLTRGIEKELRRSNIPYQLIAGFSFFEREHVKDLNSFLRIIDNPTDEVAYYRVLGLFEGIGETTAEKIYKHLNINNFDLKSLTSFKTTAKNVKGVRNFHELMSILSEYNDVESILGNLVDSFYREYLKNAKEDAYERMEDVNFMIESSKSYETITEFISDMTLTVDDDKIIENKGIVVTTYHKSKGLEWDVVFMPFIGNGILPLSPDETTEERRLFYVGVTRARKQLIITHVPYIPITQKFISESDFISELNGDKIFDYDKEDDYNLGF